MVLLTLVVILFFLNNHISDTVIIHGGLSVNLGDPRIIKRKSCVVALSMLVLNSVRELRLHSLNAWKPFSLGCLHPARRVVLHQRALSLLDMARL